MNKNNAVVNEDFFSIDPTSIAALKEFIVSSAKLGNNQLQIYLPNSFGGECAYTLAMILVANLPSGKSIKIVASESDRLKIESARNGVYPISKLNKIPLQMQKTFIEIGEKDVANWFRIKGSIKNCIQFESVQKTNLIEKYDLIFIGANKEVDNLDQFYSCAKLGARLILARPYMLIKSTESWSDKGSGSYLKSLIPQNKNSISTINSLSKKTRVLVVDDSKTICDLLTKILTEDPTIEVVGTAPNPLVAEEMRKTLKPDMITLDIHMPEMDGVTYLEKLLPKDPIPVVMITSLSLEEGGTVFKALELGAVDYIQKPTLGEVKLLAPIIREKIKSAAKAKLRIASKSAALLRARGNHSQINLETNHILAIGASTGGTEAIREVLIQLPAKIPPTVIVQHIPPIFSKAFAERLNELCDFKVTEAADGDILEPSHVYIAPGGKQMAIRNKESGFYISITDDEPVNRHKPSVDYMFESLSKLNTKVKIVGVILTGMGEDGAHGLLQLKKNGANTIGQDEKSCVVYGMPRVASEIGAVDSVCSLDEIPKAIINLLQKSKAA